SILSDEHNMFLNNLPSELTYVLLKWIYSGEINVEDISFDNLFILYELFVNIIKNDEVKKYLNGIINDRITGLVDNEIIKYWKLSFDKRFKDLFFIFLHYYECDNSNINEDYILDIAIFLKECYSEFDESWKDAISTDDIDIKKLTSNCSKSNQFELMVEALFKDRYDSDIIFDFGNERIIGAHKAILYHNLPFGLVNLEEDSVDMKNSNYDYEAFKKIIE